MTLCYSRPNYFNPDTLSYTLGWTEEDAHKLVARYKRLVSILNRLAKMREELTSEENRKKLLSTEEFWFWETFLRRFPPFEVEESVIHELFLRAEFDELNDEENELLERYYNYCESESLKRLPYKHRSPYRFIVSVMRLEASIFHNFPEEAINFESRTLAEEMILYYHTAK